VYNNIQILGRAGR